MPGWDAGGVEWRAPRALGIGYAAGGLILAAAAVLLDPAGRVLVGLAAALLLALAAREAVLRPRLSAGPGGLAVRTLAGTRRLPWAGLSIEVREVRRLGVRSRVLELDTAADPDDDGVLVVLGRHDLGADPDDVVRALRALDPGRGPG
jgi:hypothetical protein